MLSVLEGFVGTFIVLSFFSIGLSQVFAHSRFERARHQKEWEDELEKLQKSIKKSKNKKKLKLMKEEELKIIALLNEDH